MSELRALRRREVVSERFSGAAEGSCASSSGETDRLQLVSERFSGAADDASPSLRGRALQRADGVGACARAGQGCRVPQRAVSVAVQRHGQAGVDTAPGRAAGIGRRAARRARNARGERAEAGFNSLDESRSVVRSVCVAHWTLLVWNLHLYVLRG